MQAEQARQYRVAADEDAARPLREADAGSGPHDEEPRDAQTLHDANPVATSESQVVIDLRRGDPIVALPDPTITGSGLLAAGQPQLAVKRALDILGAGLGIIVLSPLLLLTALAVKLTSRGPVFYVSERVGKEGEVFRFLKFRTMVTDADRVRNELVDLNELEGPVFKMKDDPRITPLGRFLRRSSIDELPQLLHVLSGKMSLVGPRPPIPEEVDAYTDRHWRRLSVKPGLTCLWQVSGRNTIDDFDVWVDLDLHYIHNWSLGYDLRLLARTVPAVLSGRGAF